jgi:hypothetical protein
MGSDEIRLRLLSLQASHDRQALSLINDYVGARLRLPARHRMTPLFQIRYKGGALVRFPSP